MVTTGWYLLPEEGSKGRDAWRYVDREKNPTDWGVQPDISVPMSFGETIDALSHRTRWHSNLGKDVAQPVGEAESPPPDPALELALALLRARVADADGLGPAVQ